MEIERDGDTNDYFTLKVNGIDFVFESDDKGHIIPEEEEAEKFETRTEQVAALRHKSVFKKQVFSELVGKEDIDVGRLIRQPTFKEAKSSDLSDIKQRRATIANLGV